MPGSDGGPGWSGKLKTPAKRATHHCLGIYSSPPLDHTWGYYSTTAGLYTSSSWWLLNYTQSYTHGWFSVTFYLFMLNICLRPALTKTNNIILGFPLDWKLVSVTAGLGMRSLIEHSWRWQCTPSWDLRKVSLLYWCGPGDEYNSGNYRFQVEQQKLRTWPHSTTELPPPML